MKRAKLLLDMLRRNTERLETKEIGTTTDPKAAGPCIVINVAFHAGELKKTT